MTAAAGRIHLSGMARPETPNDDMKESGMAGLLEELLKTVLTDLPADPAKHLLDSLNGAAIGANIEAQERYFRAHNVRIKGTSAALEQYAADTRLMEFFAALIETAAHSGMQDPREFIKHYLMDLSKQESQQAALDGPAVP
jgi:hypothetical protein